MREHLSTKEAPRAIVPNLPARLAPTPAQSGLERKSSMLKQTPMIPTKMSSRKRKWSASYLALTNSRLEGIEIGSLERYLDTNTYYRQPVAESANRTAENRRMRLRPKKFASHPVMGRMIALDTR